MRETKKEIKAAKAIVKALKRAEGISEVHTFSDSWSSIISFKNLIEFNYKGTWFSIRVEEIE